MSETSISRTAVQQRSWCWGILKRREHKCDLYADVHDVQVHAFIYHLSLLSSSEFLCALTQGVPPAKWSCCYLQSCPMLPWFHKVTLHPPAHTKPPWCIQTHPLDPLRCHWQVALYHWVSMSQGPTQSEKNGTRLLTLWAHWWLPGWPCSCLGTFFSRWLFCSLRCDHAGSSPCFSWCISAGNSDKRVISPLLLKELTRKVNSKKKKNKIKN